MGEFSFYVLLRATPYAYFLFPVALIGNVASRHILTNFSTSKQI